MSTHSLLDNVSQFMSEKLRPRMRRGSEAIRSEHNLTADSVGSRVDLKCRARRRVVRVHPHLTEVMLESPLHAGTCGYIQRLAARVQHFVDNWWRHFCHFRASPKSHGMAERSWSVLAAFGALLPNCSVLSPSTLPAQNPPRCWLVRR